MRLILFGTAGCHLCEQAETIIADYRLTQTDFSLELIDIAEQESWQARYAIRIPVLYDPQSQTDLSWPFVLADVANFITGLKND